MLSPITQLVLATPYLMSENLLSLSLELLVMRQNCTWYRFSCHPTLVGYCKVSFLSVFVYFLPSSPCLFMHRNEQDALVHVEIWEQSARTRISLYF